jgi:hypothetical protein
MPQPKLLRSQGHSHHGPRDRKCRNYDAHKGQVRENWQGPRRR